MHILVTGAAGMIRRKLVAALIAKGQVCGQPIDRLTLADIVAPEASKICRHQRAYRGRTRQRSAGIGGNPCFSVR
jgi:nucleoside-diphosphate-sugar epimerase